MTAAADHASRLFAAEALLQRLGDLKSHLPRLERETNDGAIHQTRVASRRLRAMFHLFDGVFPSEEMHRWDRRVKRIARALGRARDIDVQNAFLDDFIAELDLGLARPGLDRLRLRLAQRRKKSQKRLRHNLGRFERGDFTDTFEQTLREHAVHARLNADLRGPTWLFAKAAERVMHLAERVLVHEPDVDEPDRVEELHDMRIAAKHLRYALEAVSPLHEGSLQTPIEVVRSIQKLLGNIHDCDVWIEFLPTFIDRERKRTRKFMGHTRGFARISQGLEALLEDRRATRRALHAEFAETWHRDCGGTLWTDLRSIVESRIPQVEVTAASAEV